MCSSERCDLRTTKWVQNATVGFGGLVQPEMARRISAKRKSASKLNREVVRAAIMEELENWRRGGDSNPRYPSGYAGFQDRCHQPLGHLSSYYSFTTMAVSGRRFRFSLG